MARSSTPSPSRSPAATTIRPKSSPGWLPDQCRSSFPVRAGVDANLARERPRLVFRAPAPPPRSRPCRRRRDRRPPPRPRRSRRGDPFPSSGTAPCRSPTRRPRPRRPSRRRRPLRRVRRRRDRRARRRRDRRAGRRTIRRTAAFVARRVGPQHRAVLAAQEIDPTGVAARAHRRRGRCARRRRGRRPAPGPSRGSRSRSPRASRAPRRSWESAPPRCPARARRPRACGAAMITSASPSPERSGTGITQWPKSPSGQLAVPRADQRAARTRPHRGAAVLERLLLELEARPGGDVRVAVAVDVERLAEAKAELTARDAPGEAPRDAPAGAGSGAGRRGRRADVGNAKPGTSRQQRRTASGRRESASPARACRRRRVLH